MNALPAVSIDPVAQLCPSAGSTTVTATVNPTTASPYTFNWTSSTGLNLNETQQTVDNSTSSVIASFSADCDKTYTVGLNIVDNKGCTAIAEPISVVVKDEAAPVIGDIADITAEAVGSNCSYKMPNLSAVVLEATRDSECGFAGNDTSFVNQSVPAGTVYLQQAQEQTIVVTVTVKDDCGNTASKDVNVIIPANMFTAGITASVNPVCYGGSTTVSVTGTDNVQGVHYAWTPAAADASSVTVDNLTETTTYMVTVSDANGCSVDLNTTVTVNNLPVVTVNDDKVCYGQGTAHLTATVTGAEPFQYVWKNGSGAIIEGETDATLTIVNETVPQTYTVEVTDHNGCKNTGIGSLSFDTIPNIEVSAENPAVCANSSLRLTATRGETYVWEAPDGVTLSATTGSSVNFSAAAAGSYTVSVTGTVGNGERPADGGYYLLRCRPKNLSEPTDHQIDCHRRIYLSMDLSGKQSTICRCNDGWYLYGDRQRQ